MGKVLKVLGVVFLVVVVGVVALFVWSHQKGEATQEAFFEAVLSGDVDRVLEQFHPELRAQVDPPVLQAWMTAAREHLGAFKGLAKNEFSTSSSTQDGVSVVESSGQVEFEKGTAHSKLRLVDGKIVAFDVTSESLPHDWFQGLEDSTFYQRQARDFLAKLAAADADGALPMMHESLRSQFTSDGLARALAELKAGLGAVVGMELVSEEFKAARPQELVLRFAVDGSESDTVGRVRFVFDKLRGHLAGFKVPDAND